MKLTKSKLREIIREEIQMLNEDFDYDKFLKSLNLKIKFKFIRDVTVNRGADGKMYAAKYKGSYHIFVISLFVGEMRITFLSFKPHIYNKRVKNLKDISIGIEGISIQIHDNRDLSAEIFKVATPVDKNGNPNRSKIMKYINNNFKYFLENADKRLKVEVEDDIKKILKGKKLPPNFSIEVWAEWTYQKPWVQVIGNIPGSINRNGYREKPYTEYTEYDLSYKSLKKFIPWAIKQGWAEYKDYGNKR